MRLNTKLLVTCISGLCVAGIVALVWNGQLKKRLHERCAAEGQASTEKFLHSDAAVALTEAYGPFIQLSGQGFFYPVWNTMGYLYLTLDRKGVFQRATIPIRIYVTEGRATAPGSNQLGQPTIEGSFNPTQGARISVSHPDLKP